MLASLKQRAYNLLRWSEKYTKTDMVYLARGGFWSVGSQVTSIAVSLVTAVLISRYVSAAVYGEYKYAVAVIATLGMFSLSGLDASLFQSAARGFDGTLQEAFRTNLRWSILIFLGAFATGSYYLAHGNTVLALSILIGGCFTPLLTSANFAGTFLAGKKDFARQAIYFGIIETIAAGAIFIGTFMFFPNTTALVLAYFGGNALATLFFYYRVIRIYRPNPRQTDTHFFSYGKNLSILGIVGRAISEIDQIILFHYTGPAEVAIYNFAIGIPDQLKGLLKSLDVMMQARFVQHLPKSIRNGMQNKTTLLGLFAVLMIAVYIPLAPLIFGFLFPAYLSAVPYSQLYMLSFISIIFQPAGSYLSSKKLLKEIYINNGISYGVQVISMLVGTMRWGLLGLVYAVIFSRIVSGMVSYILYRRALYKETQIYG